MLLTQRRAGQVGNGGERMREGGEVVVGSGRAGGKGAGSILRRGW